MPPSSPGPRRRQSTPSPVPHDRCHGPGLLVGIQFRSLTRLGMDPTRLPPIYETETALVQVSEVFQQSQQMLRTFHDYAVA